MSRRNIIDAKDDHIKTLRIIITALVVINAGLWYGWKSAPQRIQVDIPPDIRNGSVLAIGERMPASIYAFAYYIFQQLNRWTSNGDEDYKQQIYALQNYLTPACREKLNDDYQKRQLGSELRDRERTVVEMRGRGYDDKRVYIESPDSWIVYLDLQISETYRGQPVKNVYARYPLRVVRYDADPERNRFQLALDCEADEPRRIELEPKSDPKAAGAQEATEAKP